MIVSERKQRQYIVKSNAIKCNTLVSLNIYALICRSTREIAPRVIVPNFISTLFLIRRILSKIYSKKKEEVHHAYTIHFEKNAYLLDAMRHLLNGET